MIQPIGDGGVLNAVRQAFDNTTAARVFGTPVVQDGVIVLPVAKIQGGGGGGGRLARADRPTAPGAVSGLPPGRWACSSSRTAT